jgi:hypothetical protein
VDISGGFFIGGGLMNYQAFTNDSLTMMYEGEHRHRGLLRRSIDGRPPYNGPANTKSILQWQWRFLASVTAG